MTARSSRLQSAMVVGGAAHSSGMSLAKARIAASSAADSRGGGDCVSATRSRYGSPLTLLGPAMLPPGQLRPVHYLPIEAVSAQSASPSRTAIFLIIDAWTQTARQATAWPGAQPHQAPVAWSRVLGEKCHGR
jgi:hypothetical protein